MTATAVQAALCQCGCGRPTLPATRTTPSRGCVRGEPSRFLSGHYPRTGRRHPALEPNPSATCLCGCGERTMIATVTNRTRGEVKGQPKRYVRGHSGRVARPGTYRKGRGAEKREHVLVVERALGHALPAGAVVHHVNGNRSDNRPTNLVACQDTAYHGLLHRRQRALAACGHADWRFCQLCGGYEPPGVLTGGNAQGHKFYHRECRQEYRKGSQ